MRYLLLYLVLASVNAQAQLPRVAGGTIKRFESFASRFVQPRTVDVWLPPGYANNGHYPVLYMHDGQMLFDSTRTWNGQEWQADEVAISLLNRQMIKPFILVAIWNNGSYRHAEYFPAKPLQYLSQSLRDSIVLLELKGHARADDYLRFIVQELKPFVDSTFSTSTDAGSTYIAGSSMGGLISLYALCEYPSVFGGAACLSTHWPGSLRRLDETIPSAFIRYMEEKLPSPGANRLYFDLGNATLDSLYPPFQLKADALMKRRGYSSALWQTRLFEGAAHTEKAWADRLHLPLIFLLGK